MEEKGQDYLGFTTPGTPLSSKDLLTHKSGLPKYHNSVSLVWNGLFGNPFEGISKEKLFQFVQGRQFSSKSFRYSNLGYSILGHGTADFLGTTYESLMLKFLKNDLNMKGSYFTKGTGNLSKYWSLEENNGYAPADGLVSNIEDMGNYLEQILTGRKSYLRESLKIISGLPDEGKLYQKLGSSMDAIGAAWIYDSKNGYYWHNGATTNFNSYMAFHPKRRFGVVILSSKSYLSTLPATVLGIKIMEEGKGTLSDF